MRRRSFMAGAAGLLAGGCTQIGRSDAFGAVVDAAEAAHRTAHRALGGSNALAREYAPSQISPYFRGNGSVDIDTPEYRQAEAEGFVGWHLAVGGLVENPFRLALGEIRALPQRSQITRHDCVEGWSAIGQWAGPPLGLILERARLAPEARYIVFHCADLLAGARYYESCDLDDAFHPQTIIAHQLNGEPLPVRNGAPLRLRIERQLGYKHAKFLTGIEAVAGFEHIAGGRGGYWEDRGYQWYAGV